MTRNTVNYVKLDFSKYLKLECMNEFFLMKIFQGWNRPVREILGSKCTMKNSRALKRPFHLPGHWVGPLSGSINAKKYIFNNFYSGLVLIYGNKVDQMWESKEKGLWEHTEHHRTQYECKGRYNWNESKLEMLESSSNWFASLANIVNIK